jgi:MFS transporter, putative metabolite:H+ symporter
MSQKTSPTESRGPSLRDAWLIVLVAALGYFVDIYDLILFSVVRKKSLIDLGVVGDTALTDSGVTLINTQMTGMLLGGILWGVLGDKRGRLSVLFGSIVLYSIANIANGFVHDVTTYAVLRFVAGVGLAGELGAGVTLVSEMLGKSVRGYGTTIVAGVGVTGAVVAVLVGKATDWRVAYFVGGGLGLGLLALRIGVNESGLFQGMKKRSDVRRGNFLALFTSSRRAIRYVCVILSGLPIWYAVGILFTFAPEIGTAMGLKSAPSPADAVLYGYIGLAIGDVACGVLSQLMKSRRRAVLVFILLCACSVSGYFIFGAGSLQAFYWGCFGVGVGTGYWAVFVTMASEQFGTNLRATATTTAPNFVRGAVVPLTLGFRALKDSHGAADAAMIVGAITIVIALLALIPLEETYGRDLDFVEE